MEYPIWIIPGVSKGLIMAAVSVLHVFVSQFAVGGGIYLVWMERKALAGPGKAEAGTAGRAELLGWLQKHTRFFLLLTMVFGALSGVGIWFTMSVINPAATSALIHVFLWIWAAEWVFFLTEIAALLAYHYSYPLLLSGRIRPETHLRIGYIYAFSAFMSLLLINGVISFMLTPGAALASGNLAQAFFNPSFLPSLVFRSALCLMLAGMFALFTASRISNSPTRHLVIRSAGLWVCLPLLVLLASSFWYFAALPPDRQAAVLRRTADIRPFALAYGWIVPIIFLLGVFAFVRAEKLRRPLTVLILCTGLVLVGSFEWMREAGRRPWVVPGYMYSSSIRPQSGEVAAKHGLAALSGWLAETESRAASAGKAAEPSAAQAQAKAGPIPALGRGEIIFAQQCGACHAVNGPRLNILPRLAAFTPRGLKAQIRGQGTAPLDYMPPFYGSDADLDALALYLSLKARQR